MKKLHIIGNGFDLHHGLKTSYENYLKHLSLEHLKPIKNNTIRDIQGLDWTDDATFEKYLEVEVNENEIETWGDLEGILGDCLRNQTVRELRSLQLDDLEKIFKRSNIREWILKVNETITDDKKDTYFSEIFTNDDLFLCFNYTETLNKLYGISNKNICYIHGKASDIDSKIYFGHSYDIEEEKRLSKVNSSIYNIPISEYPRLDNLISSSYKPLETIYNNHLSFFKSLLDIEHINIIGHQIAVTSVGLWDPVDPKNFDKSFSKDTMDNYYYSMIKNHAIKLKSIDFYLYPDPPKDTCRSKLDYLFPYEYEFRLAGSCLQVGIPRKHKLSVKLYPKEKIDL